MTLWKRAVFFSFGWAAKAVASMWMRTCRITEFGREIEGRLSEEHPGRGLLYASWHRGLFFVVYWFRNQNVVSMASASEDGELAAQAAKRFGWITTRGSSSRGGRQAFREMEALVHRGYKGGLVADAPQGPRFVFQTRNHLSGQTDRASDHSGDLECGSPLDGAKLGSHHCSKTVFPGLSPCSRIPPSGYPRTLPVKHAGATSGSSISSSTESCIRPTISLRPRA